MTAPDAIRFRGGAWLPGNRRGVVSVSDGRLVGGGRARVDDEGSVLPGVSDAHVHLTLIDPAGFARTPVDRVRDLGGAPDAVREAAGRCAPVEVTYAGRFHTARGGYPTGRVWAPDTAVRQVADAADARRAVRAWASEHGTLLKIVLHAGMPLLDDPTLSALVETAHEERLTVVAHVEGAGQTARAVAAGVDELAHTPWTERVQDDVIAAAVARGMVWVTTLSIHAGTALATAADNLSRFTDAGGRVRYGTDLGNGELPVGVNETELFRMGEAGIRGDALLTAVLGEPRPLARAWHSPYDLPADARELVRWLREARPITPASIAAVIDECRGAS